MARKNESYAEKYGVKPNQKIYVVGKLVFSSLAEKDTKLKYPIYYVKIKNPKFFNPDGSTEGNFIDAAKDDYIYKSRSGEYIASIDYKPTEQKPFVDIIGHAEEVSEPADKLLSNGEGKRPAYFEAGQTVKACVYSYGYTDRDTGEQRVSQSLKYLEIDSLNNAKIAGRDNTNKFEKNAGFNPFD